MHLSYWRLGPLKVSVGLKAVERNGWKPYSCLWCGHHSDISYLLFLGVTSFPLKKYMGFAFLLYSS